ncbi:MAG: glycine cleavage system protein GcvH [bacterium]
MNIPENLRYTQTHEWARIEGDEATIGITDFAQHQLTDIVYVEMPEIGAAAVQGKEIGVVESCKIAADLYAPVSGEVVAINDRLADEPQLVNNDPYGEGWIIKIRLSNPSEADALMDAKAYAAVAVSEE